MRYKGITTDTKPWYKYFWPWFVLGIVFWTLMSASGMLYFAYKDPYSIVADSNKVGKIITSDSKSSQMAQDLGIKALVTREPSNFKIVLTPEGYANDYKNLTLMIVHPTDQNKDKVLKLKLVAGHLLSEKITDDITNWQIKLNNSFAGWMISGRLKSGFENKTTLK